MEQSGTAYEQERDERVARNQQELLKLGVGQASACAACAAPASRALTRLPPRRAARRRLRLIWRR
jgi:hypothetical protein